MDCPRSGWAEAIGDHRSAQAQQGAAALVVTLMLFFAMLLSALFVNRNLIFEQRSSANQYRATQAFEAAEAGLEWAAAQLNANQRIGADCAPALDPAATSFRARYLSVKLSGPSTAPGTAPGTITPVTWADHGIATPLQPTCVRLESGWSCHCPASGFALLSPALGETPTPTPTPMPTPTFAVTFLPADKPGLVRVSVTGCSSFDGLCRHGSTSRADAVAHLEVLLGLVQGLRTPPAAAIEVRGDLHAESGAIGLHNADPATGLAAHVGGTLTAPDARWSGPAGTPSAALLASNDATLAGLDPERLFATHFGLERSAWKQQPAVTRLQCSGDCSGAVAATIAAHADALLLWVEGDLALTGPLVLGTLDAPILIVADGDVQIDGPVAICGLVYGRSLRWDNSGEGAFLRGAAIVEGPFIASGKVDLYRDTGVLAQLSLATGSFVRVSGSWRDF